MKKYGFLLLLMVAFLLPVVAFAEVKPDKEFTANEKEVKVYFFHGDGCPHCADAEEWFKSIEKEYGDKFEVIAYETWSNSDNDEFMHAISDYKEDNVEGVPYILIGKHSCKVFDQDYSSAILNVIESMYKQDPKERYDIMDYVSPDGVKTSSAVGIIALILIILVPVGIGILVFFLRKRTN